MANSVDPNQTPHSVASDLGLHYLLSQIVSVFNRVITVYIITKMKNEYFTYKILCMETAYHNYSDRQALAYSVDSD